MGTVLVWKSQIPGSNYEDIDEQNPLPMQQVLPALFAQGYNTFSLTVAATNNLTVIKPVGGQVFGWAIYNSSATVPVKMLLYNKGLSTGGAPVIATDTGRIVHRIGVPATALGAGNNFQMPGLVGLGQFPDGIGIAVVASAPGTLADTDTTAPAAGSALINIYYI